MLLLLSADIFHKLIFQNYLSGTLSDFNWDFGELPFPSHLGKYIIKIEKISAKIHEIGKIMVIFDWE